MTSVLVFNIEAMFLKGGAMPRAMPFFVAATIERQLLRHLDRLSRTAINFRWAHRIKQCNI